MTKKLSCLLLAIIFIFSSSFITIFAEDKSSEENVMKTYDMTDVGIKVQIPSYCDVFWTGMDDNDPIIANCGFSNKQDALKRGLYNYFQLSAYTNNIDFHIAVEDQNLDFRDFTSLPDEQKEQMAKVWNELYTESNMGLKLNDEPTHEFTTINGIDYYLTHSTFEKNDFYGYFEDYLTVINGYCVIFRTSYCADTQENIDSQKLTQLNKQILSTAEYGEVKVSLDNSSSQNKAIDGMNLYNVTDLGIEVQIPSDMNTYYEDMDESDPAITAGGYSSKKDALNKTISQYFQLMSLNTDYKFYVQVVKSKGIFKISDLTEASDEEIEEARKVMESNYVEYGIGGKFIETPTFEIITINGIKYFKTTYSCEGTKDSPNPFVSVTYDTIKDGNIVSLSGEYNNTDKSKLDALKVNGLMDQIINTVKYGVEKAQPAQSAESANQKTAKDGMKLYDLPYIGITIQFPSDMGTFWKGMDENDPAITEWGFSSKKDAIDQTISERFDLMSFKNNYTFYMSVNKCGYDLLNLTGASDDVHKGAKETIKGMYTEDFLGVEFIQKPTLENVTINGVDYIKTVFTCKGPGYSSICEYYDTVINGCFVGLYCNYSNPDESELTADKISGLMEQIMNNVEYGEVKVSTYSDQGADVQNESIIDKILAFDFPMWIIVVVLVIVLFAGSNISKKKEWQEAPLSLENSKCIQGFCAVAIIIHHLSQNLSSNGDIGALGMFVDIGVMFVGIFFFFSGYGLFKSFKTKEGYLNGFFKKRFSTILVPFYMCILVFIFNSFVLQRPFQLWRFVAELTGWSLINSHMWYIVEIAILYVFFFFVFRFIKKENVAIIVMGILTAGMTVGSLLLGHGQNFSCQYWFMGEWWFNTTMLFFVGILIAKNEAKIYAFAKRFYVWLLPLSAIITIVLFKFTTYALNNYSYYYESSDYMGYKEKFICLGFQLPMVIFAVFTLLLIMMKVKFNNPILKFLGTISLELYLIHNLFLTGFSESSIANITSNSMFVVLTVLCSIALAVIISRVDKYILSIIQKKRTVTDSTTKKIHSIDCMRFIMAFLVVCIHLPFQSQVGQAVISFGKTAVPFFLVICGYFLYRDDNGEFFSRLKKQTKRILFITIGANILFAAVGALITFIKTGSLATYTNYFTLENLKNFLLFNMSPFGDHLWYLGSLLYALLILMLLCKTKLHKYVMFASPILLGVYIYLSWFGNAEYFVYRNALFVTLPYVMMGCLIRRYEDKLMKIKSPILWILALVLCVTTFLELNFYSRGTSVPFFSAEILVYVIVLLTLKYRNFGEGTLLEKLGSKCTLFIYIVHMVPILFITQVLPINQGFISNYGPITIFIITTLVAVLFKIKAFVPKKQIEITEKA